MSYSKENVLGVGCDFELGTEGNSRKYAIENLSGGEEKE